MMDKPGLLVMLGKRANGEMDYEGDGEYMGFEVAAKDIMEALRDNDVKLFSYALKDFIHMCMGHGESEGY